MKPLKWLCRPIAHRGLHDKSAGIIENTLSAVEAAVACGYAVEVDVQPAADLTPMVFHDDTLDRLTQALGPVSVHSPGALRAVLFKDCKDHMPTLLELLQFVQGRIPVIIEIKSGTQDRAGYAAAIANTLRGYEGHAAVMSFDPRIVAAMAKAAPTIARGLVATNEPHVEGKLGWWRRFQMRHLLWRRQARAQFIAYDVRALPALAPFLARTLHGMPLLTWTVRSEEDRRRAERWADAMIFEGFRP